MDIPNQVSGPRNPLSSSSSSPNSASAPQSGLAARDIESGHVSSYSPYFSSLGKAMEKIDPMEDFGESDLQLTVHSVKELLKKSEIDINQAIMRDKTALMIAVQAGSFELVECLLNYGASCGIQDEYGQTALMMAVRKGDPEIVGLLLSRSDAISTLNSINKDGKTALDLAQNDKPIFNRLLEAQRRQVPDEA